MYLGIDLGTSNSAIVGIDSGGIRLFKTEDGKDVLSSTLYFDRRGHMSVGTRAQAQAELSPENVAQGFKRLMGTSSTIELKGADKILTPEEASTEIIRQLIRQATAESGSVDVAGAIITIPAAFNQMQSEATIRAARAAGLSRVGLLQEPVAAAMAALEGASRRDGRFLVYDLGGGTFDVALVEASGGAVNVIAHEGINMLGGRDFDRGILDTIVRPWLAEKFDLPADAAVRPEYRRMFGILRMKVEMAKIELSSRDKTIVFLSEEDARATDNAGTEIYTEVEVSRAQLETLIADQIDDSITLCRKILTDNGLNHEDIDRIVFIGGPSKMPVIRETVSRELGVPADHKTDPMTAVARGAAIFAESRDWGSATGQRKSARGSLAVEGKLELKLAFTARTSDENAKLRITADTQDKSYCYQITGPQGFDSGIVNFDGKASLSLPLPSLGAHQFKLTVTDVDGQPACEPQTIEFMRSAATAAAIHATQTVSVKIADGPASERRNILVPLISKGTPLPVKNTSSYRLRETLTGGIPSHFDVELFNHAEGVDDPLLNLSIGVFRIRADDILDDGDSLVAGSSIEIHWSMDDNGLINCEVAIPDLGIHLDNKSYYVPQANHERFDGDEGELLATKKLGEAQQALSHARSALGASSELDRMERRLARQQELLDNSIDAEARRLATEEALHVQQELARLSDAPEHRKAMLLQEIDRIEEGAADLIEKIEAETAQRLSTLLHSAREELSNGNWKKARDLVEQARSIFQRALFQQPTFIAAVFENLRDERFSALDKNLHDQLTREGDAAIAAGDVDSLREVVAQMFGNRMPTEHSSKGVSMLAGLLR
ncbi:Hsp70 family protein [Sphingopyxis sp. USTB-05]|uniref:Hsp70 family protein n=1 Tax=Sphingopyxis sp. USTB-05 TaxID=2830667 RepID=UPI002078556B|nr:Hsp70 family protein [Sphingopyxis sp. USTB-05]USI79078.1 Hsp70 family protein [Sphingopyxis sp. USTB-05]